MVFRCEVLNAINFTASHLYSFVEATDLSYLQLILNQLSRHPEPNFRKHTFNYENKPVYNNN